MEERMACISQQACVHMYNVRQYLLVRHSLDTFLYNLKSIELYGISHTRVVNNHWTVEWNDQLTDSAILRVKGL